MQLFKKKASFSFDDFAFYFMEKMDEIRKDAPDEFTAINIFIFMPHILSSL